MAEDLTIPDFLDRRKAHSKRAHARLAPSASKRWMECPGSVRMSEGIESKSSVYAAEGTAAHELAAHCLSNDYNAERFANYVIDITGKTFGERLLMPGSPLADDRFEVDEEMVEGVQLYLDHVRSLLKEDCEIDVEQRLDMTHLHPDIYGTGDALIYHAAREALWVLDFKYGKGVAVEVPENPQLLAYGSGAAKRYGNRGLKKITLVVVQPRAPHPAGPIRSAEYDVLDLLEFENKLADAAKATEASDAPLKAGEWCRFCPALPTCPQAREKAVADALSEFAEPENMNDEQLASVLKEADSILTWVKAVQAYAHAEATAGRCPPGYKLVPKRASRKWKFEEAEIKDRLCMEFDLSEDDILTEPELKSAPQVEKVIGKKAFQAVEAALVAKVSSGTNLVPIADPRPAVKQDGLEEFSGE